jgi:hypothetical protein
MLHITVERTTVNPAALHDELTAALGKACYGLSAAAGIVTVHLAESAADQADTARAIVHAHDPKQLTPAQQTAQDRADLPFFKLDRDALVTLAAGMDAASFRREMARAFAHLRDLIVVQSDQ